MSLSDPGFNPRARTGRDGIDKSSAFVVEEFQSTRPHGARPRQACAIGADIEVSIHAPARGATPTAPDCPCSHLRFQSTRPHGARLRWRDRLIERSLFQSTRPHGARPHGYPEAIEYSRVSIHAPARGATALPPAWNGTLIVSIHAPARGATRRRADADVEPRGFNPRARTGRDSRGQYESLSHSVSIHAPARGATCWHGQSASSAMFQSTRPHGARLYAGFDKAIAMVFQSTRPHGARRIHSSSLLNHMQFQSTRPHGARPEADGGYCVQRQVSIHAPARGATSMHDDNGEPKRLFQSTRPHGARQTL